MSLRGLVFEPSDDASALPVGPWILGLVTGRPADRSAGVGSRSPSDPASGSPRWREVVLSRESPTGQGVWQNSADHFPRVRRVGADPRTRPSLSPGLSPDNRCLGTNGDADAHMGHTTPGPGSERAHRVSRRALRSSQRATLTARGGSAAVVQLLMRRFPTVGRFLANRQP